MIAKSNATLTVMLIFLILIILLLTFSCNKFYKFLIKNIRHLLIKFNKCKFNFDFFPIQVKLI